MEELAQASETALPGHRRAAVLAGSSESVGTRAPVAAGRGRTWGKAASLPRGHGQGGLPRLYG